MKATRRQELRTNRLSQQIEQIGQYAKEHTISLVAAVVVGVLVIGAAYWYYAQRQRDVMDAWYALSASAAAVDGDTPIETIESVARKDLQPALTAEALLRLGDKAMARLAPTGTADGGQAGDSVGGETDWSAKADQAYREVAERFSEPAHMTASGKAKIMLGVLAENADDAAKARQWYEQIISDERFAGTPFFDNATFRLKNLDRWLKPVVFPGPTPTFFVPEPTPPPRMTTSPRRLPVEFSTSPAEPGSVGEASAPTDATPAPDAPAPDAPAPDVPAPDAPAPGGDQPIDPGDPGAATPATQPSGGTGASP